MTFRLRPTDFYDWEMLRGSDGIERYVLCRNGERLRPGHAIVWPFERRGTVRYRLVTTKANGDVHLSAFSDIDKAFRAGADWAERQDDTSSTKGADR